MTQPRGSRRNTYILLERASKKYIPRSQVLLSPSVPDELEFDESGNLRWCAAFQLVRPHPQPGTLVSVKFVRKVKELSYLSHSNCDRQKVTLFIESDEESGVHRHDDEVQHPVRFVEDDCVGREVRFVR